MCDQLRESNAALFEAQATVNQREKELLERDVVSFAYFELSFYIYFELILMQLAIRSDNSSSSCG